mmetsp:Transcript_21119/g.29838  ORF Transcript_21119/g.29838 Transcript_21119/m.29838 type:complete len:207 (-) Transcript_21119:186-806(-)
MKFVSIACLVSVATAFSPVNVVPTATTSRMTLRATSSSASETSRRQLFTNLIVQGGIVATTTLGVSPMVANADVTNKIASSSALRNVKRSIKQLDTLELYVVNNEYLELKQAIRVAPIAEIRKNCNTLIKGGEDGPDAEKLVEGYNTFIKALESLDGTASLGSRGRTIPEGQFSEQYKATVAALSDFVKVAEDSVAIPVQYSAESS